MKFIHLADLHIGKVAYGFPLLADQEFALAQALKLVEAHKPDAVVIAGDVYEKAVPAADAVRVFDDFLTSLAALGPAVMIISGNHDSPERLGFASGIMRNNNVHLYGAFDGKMRVVTLRDGYGEVRFHLLPHIKPADVRRFTIQKVDMVGDPSDAIETYQDAIETVISSANIDRSVRNVLVAHQFFAAGGAESEHMEPMRSVSEHMEPVRSESEHMKPMRSVSEHMEPVRSDSEREIVGGLDRVDVAACGIAALFDYAAFGHLHGPQRVGAEHIRYSGSLLKYSFSECAHKKAALLVELKNKGELTVTPLPVIPLRDMRRIRGPIEALLNARAGVGDSSDDDYLHVVLTDENDVYDARGKLNTVYPNVMQITFDNSRMRAGLDPNVEMFGVDVGGEDGLDILARPSPLSLFEEFYFAQNGARMDDAQRKTIESIINNEESGEIT